MLGLYVHIPFCQAICHYCNFNRGLLDEDLERRYVAALVEEIRAFDRAEPADTVFFGGGTPSLLDAAEVDRILSTCRARFDLAAGAEVTLEVNPETATPDRLDAMLAAGVNRLSFGVQSLDDRELQRLGRVHSADTALRAIAAARQAGFANISLDLMFWLPGQSRASWLDSVRRAIDLGPDHLSLYMLELYPNAPLREQMARRTSLPDGAPADWVQADDDEAADMYLEALEVLDAAGYQQYEISNVARPGFEGRHNLKYWRAGSWVGFGCGAHSTAFDHRWRNVSSTAEYIDRIARGEPVAAETRALSPAERVGEALFTGLRLSAGIDRVAFRERFGVDPWASHAGRLAAAVDEGHVWMDGTRFGLTRTGMLVSNEILEAFV